MFGTPVAESQWRLVNAIGAAILLVGATAPLAMLRAWRWPRARPALLALCWIAALTVVGLLSAFGVIGDVIVA